jgi:hypothetical protein
MRNGVRARACKPARPVRSTPADRVSASEPGGDGERAKRAGGASPRQWRGACSYFRTRRTSLRRSHAGGI